jgi:hypothetical protein
MPDIKLRDGSVTKDPRLTRMPWHDPKSLLYGITSIFKAKRELKTKTWRLTEWFDQGREGACTGFAVGHELAAYPVAVKDLDNKFCREQLYWEAQKIDPFPGGAYPGAEKFMEGSTVLAAVKVAKRLGYIEEYRWAFSVHDLALAIGHVGPAVLGVPWYDGMFSPASCGLLHPIGEKVGGHAILCRGFNARNRTFLVHNSWGKGWGNKGTARISWEDMKYLLRGTGDACIPMKRAYGPSEG